MKRKTVIITGAHTGAGKATALQIATQGHRVILTCRNPEDAKAIQKEIGITALAHPLDPSNRRSIHDFTDWIHREIGELDVLINHAEVFNPTQTQRILTTDGFELAWFTNHLAPVLLTDRVLDLLIASPQGRILNIAANGLFEHPFHNINLNDPMFNHRPFSASKAYYQSKLAQIMHIRWLSLQLSGTMVTANSIKANNMRLNVHKFTDLPQWIKNLYTLKAMLSVSPEKMAQTYSNAALSPDFKNLTGAQIAYPSRTTRNPIYANDPVITEQVMQLTYKQLGITPAISYDRP